MDRMLQAIRHRGPDDLGISHCAPASTGHRVSLGHCRLSIIDVRGARQPMHDDTVGLTLVFNGEIYNFRELRTKLKSYGYRFERDSDTEVLLRAYRHWGERVVEHVRGMFAFAIWDARNERLTLARDRFGEKPLFLCRIGSSIYFASEIKALLQLPSMRAEVNRQAVWDYLAYRYVPAPATLFKQVYKLMPGTLLTWERGGVREKRYWRSDDCRALPKMRSRGDKVAQFLDCLDDAVQLEMVSDVPYGAFLSGGIDSSTIVALMRRHSADVKTFSVGFGEKEYSELPYAREVAQQLGTSHHEIVVDEQDIVDKLPALVRFRDAPVAEPSDVPIYMLACEASRSVKMVLTGEGSDELLGGYPKHAAECYVDRYQRLPRAIRRHLIAPLTDALPYSFRRVKSAVANIGLEDTRERYAHWFGALNSRERRAMTTTAFLGSDRMSGVQFDAEPRTSALRRILYFDQMSWLPDNLLERTDRMTMAASIEARVPYLDCRLAKFAASLPDNYRVRGRSGKWVLRQAATRLIPARVLQRPKVGFRVPVHEWFRGPMRDYLLDHLRGPGSRTREYYDPDVLGTVIDEHIGGRHNHEKLLWSLMNLEIWHRNYV